ncbi:hypothetical protein P9112_008223 [Eukaryota sp. TZLM1-RC]
MSKYVKVFFADGASKTVSIQRSTTAQQLVDSLVEKLGLKFEPETFALFESRGDVERCIHKDDIPFEILSVWGNDKTAKFLLKKRYFMRPDITPDEEADLHMLYIQARADVLSGDLNVTEQDVTYLAGLHCQVSFSDHQPERHCSGFLTRAIHDYVPTSIFKQNDARRWEELIFEEHGKLKGECALECMKKYLEKCRSYTAYGHILFPVKWSSEGSRRVNLRAVVAVGIGGISILRIPSKEVIGTHPFNDILSWGCSATTFAFTVGDPETINAGIAEQRKFTFETRRGNEITSAVQGYVDLLIVQMSRDDQEFNEARQSAVAAKKEVKEAAFEEDNETVDN